MHLRPALICLAVATLVPLQTLAASGIFGFVDTSMEMYFLDRGSKARPF